LPIERDSPEFCCADVCCNFAFTLAFSTIQKDAKDTFVAIFNIFADKEMVFLRDFVKIDSIRYSSKFQKSAEMTPERDLWADSRSEKSLGRSPMNSSRDSNDHIEIQG